MRRTAVSRVIAALVGLWLAVALSEPAALHACAMHGGGHQLAGAGHGAARGHHATGAHASPHSTAPDARHAACTCLGACCAATTVAMPAAPSGVAVRVVERPVRRHHVAATEFRLAEPAYARPPSHAPPGFTA